MNDHIQISDLPQSSIDVAARAHAIGHVSWCKLRTQSTDELLDLKAKVLKALERKRKDLHLIV